MFMHGHRRQRIAIIGSGISGLGAAWLLDPHHDVVLFEAEPRPGGHARTVRALGVDVDTGFIVCNRRTYPLFAPLMDHLGVALEPSDMSFSASFGGGSYEYGTFSTRAMFAQPMCLVDAGHWRLIRDILRFFREAPAHHRHDGSIGELLGRLRLGQEFRDRFLLPISGAIWSTPARDMMDFPAGTFVRFFDNHGLLSVKGQPQWLTVTGGSRRYVQAILGQLRGQVRLNCPVRAILRGAQGPQVVSDRGVESFDRVILATHAPQALALLDRADAQERAILGALRTQLNRVVLHSDPALMPRRRAAWASWNFVTRHHNLPEDQPISLSYWMNRLQNLQTPQPLIVTLNPETEPQAIHDETWLAHPQFDAAAIAAQADLPQIQGRGGIHYCGAWTRYGFHEDGLLSALRVAQSLGVDWPLGADPWAETVGVMA
ncbi:MULTISPECIES: NAD(P)/FAD-dependent oxidoreductase [unclassified Paracoccus (in: a-proteobacteria)]|uniref:NAD(P)/FAD-dependent oxidoreductase n=1 Tax=unclassified Paracoccus (in: a-proteobacteria) TaxID=2688777 RepID=UPI001E40D30D|nr:MULTISPECIES: FAD-dependent oxidoreductase [unclassified Paracoccus (in: a-proteobacteria)]UXU76035.1 FAD-dependent oxidoreductase [Paracoccus sp. SMMA_5]UXU81945.1 FAD-dependent oxidoreductase [Paracoccus sp. SMMA_5_TC]